MLNRKRPPRLQRFALRHHHRGRAHRGVLARDTPCAHTRVRQISPGQTRDPPLATPPPAGVAPCSAWLWRGHHARTSHLAASAARSPRAAHTYAQVMRPRAVPSPRTALSRHVRPLAAMEKSQSPHAKGPLKLALLLYLRGGAFRKFRSLARRARPGIFSVSQLRSGRYTLLCA